MQNKWSNDTNNFIEHDKISKDCQQQILDLNLRQLIPTLTADNSFSKAFTAVPGDRIIISNLPSNPNHSSSKFCDKISIEVTSTNKNTITFKLTISNKTFAIEKQLPGKS